ncbi:MAG: retroviral-like aspartic protease family protein [Chitinophagaceae bacterium]|nr:retroviral-like aspartic protease family protein [Chitinophagaceae bacterium]
MNRIALILVINMISTVSYGQKKEIFRDDFNNNFNRWSEAKETNQERFFRGGQYYIINNESGILTWNTQNVDIDQNENFIIETSVALNWQKDGSAYLIFGEDNRSSKNCHCLSIQKVKNKYTTYIGKRIDGEWVGVWKNGKIKDFGQQNILTVKKKKNKISFYVNGSLVHSKDFEPFFGNGVGVGCGAPQNASFDYLTVKQDKKNKTSEYVYETKRENKGYTTLKTEVKLKKSGGVYEVPVELNGVLKIDFIFDSGASDVSISPDVALTLIKTGTIKESDWLPGAYYKFADGTTAKSMRFKLKSVKIGDKVVYDVTCSISNSLDAPMLLGQSVLSKFGSYTFDYKNGKLIIE